MTENTAPDGAHADLAKFLKTKATTAEYTRVTLRTATVEKAADAIAELVAQVVEAEKYNGWHQQACVEIERLRAMLANIEAGLNMLHRAIAEGDPARELMLRTCDLADECARAALTPKD
jgi:hypothetical protein